MLHSCDYLSENEEEVRLVNESDVSIDDYLKFKSEEFQSSYNTGGKYIA